jgi:hypothetical protein
MKVAIVSDSHDNVPLIRAAVRAFRDRGAEGLIHAGDFVAPFAVKSFLELDVPTVAVFGNCDGERRVISELLPDVTTGARRAELGGRTFTIVHSLEWLDPGDRDGADVVVHGHTHRAEIQTEDGQLVLNPGECAGWVTGRSTAVVLDTETMIPDLFELS